MPNSFHASPFQACPNSGFHDERLALSLEQGVLLWCLRASVSGMKRGIDVESRIDGMLEALGAPAAARSLREFISALSQGCTRMIEVRCVCQKRLDADERALLDVLSLAQAMRPFEALLVLRGFVTQAGAREALRGAEAVVAALTQAGRFLPEPEQEVRHLAIAPDMPGISPYLQTIH
jgi:hypothetical protein